MESLHSLQAYGRDTPPVYLSLFPKFHRTYSYIAYILGN